MTNADTIGGMLDTSAGVQESVRESIIATAVNFLKNPNVQRSPVSQKQKFLRAKGLTENEIQIACDRAGVFTLDPNSTIVNMTIDAPVSPSYSLQRPQTTFQKIKDVLGSVALFSGLIYAAYLFYKRYIEPFLFGKKKSVEETLKEMQNKVEVELKKVGAELSLIRESISNSNNHPSHHDFNNLKSDIEAIKGLLLNRKQFASPLPLGPPSIPAWQLRSQSHSEAEHDKNDDAGSGSGSSETEVVTKNSDSSLEIM